MNTIDHQLIIIDNLEYLRICINNRLSNIRNKRPFILHLIFNETNKLLNGKLNYYTINRTYYHYIVMLYDLFPDYFKNGTFTGKYNSHILNIDGILTKEKLQEIDIMFNNKIQEMKNGIEVD